MNQMFILKRTKRKLFHIHMTIVKALREKQERNYFLFYKEKLRLRQDKGLAQGLFTHLGQS